VTTAVVSAGIVADVADVGLVEPPTSKAARTDVYNLNACKCFMPRSIKPEMKFSLLLTSWDKNDPSNPASIIYTSQNFLAQIFLSSLA